MFFDVFYFFKNLIKFQDFWICLSDEHLGLFIEFVIFLFVESEGIGGFEGGFKLIEDFGELLNLVVFVFDLFFKLLDDFFHSVVL